MKLRLFIIFICTLLCCSYVIPLGIYLLPINPATIKIKPKIKSFMNELFYQDWHLFAPNPSQRIIKMYIRCKNKKKWTNWFNPIEKLQKIHEKNRFSLKGLYYRHYNYIVTSLRSSYRFTNTRAVKKIKKNNKIENLAKKFSGDICLYKMKTKSVKVEFKVFDFHPKQHSDRNFKKALMVYTARTFGPYFYENDIKRKIIR